MARGEGSNSRGYDSRWRAARVNFLRQHPLCVGLMCKGRGDAIPASIVDHVIPHRGDQALFWDENNWQPLCVSCHNRKTANEVNARNAALAQALM